MLAAAQGMGGGGGPQQQVRTVIHKQKLWEDTETLGKLGYWPVVLAVIATIWIYLDWSPAPYTACRRMDGAVGRSLPCDDKRISMAGTRV